MQKCADGTWSSSFGPGSCSWHGGTMIGHQMDQARNANFHFMLLYCAGFAVLFLLIMFKCWMQDKYSGRIQQFRRYRKAGTWSYKYENLGSFSKTAWSRKYTCDDGLTFDSATSAYEHLRMR